MKIELHCLCGSMLLLENGNPTYINSGGFSDEKGRKFLIEVRADEWLDRHQSCISLSTGEKCGALTRLGESPCGKTKGHSDGHCHEPLGIRNEISRAHNRGRAGRFESDK